DHHGYVLFPTVMPLCPVHLAHSASSPASSPACICHMLVCTWPVLAGVPTCSPCSLGSICLSGGVMLIWPAVPIPSVSLTTPLCTVPVGFCPAMVSNRAEDDVP